MTTKTVTITLSIIGGIIGLGFLAHYCFQPDATEEKPNDANYNGEKKQPLVKVNAPVASQEPIMHAPKDEPIMNNDKRETEVFIQPKAEEEDQQRSMLPAGDEFPLRLGSKGPHVERLQIWLMRNYGRTGKVTGVFDAQTETQVIKRFHKEILDQGTYQRMRMGKPVYEQVIIR